MYERKSYERPPIEEAVCEFRFRKDDWNPTTPGQLFEKLKESYSAPPKELKQFEAQFTAGPQKPAIADVRELPSLIRFSTEDEHKLLSIGPQRLAVSMRRPYSNWEEFRNQILTALREHRSITGADEVSRVGVRYINKIVIEAINPIDLTKYFRCAPQDLSEITHEDLPRLINSVFLRQDFTFGDSTRLTRIFATTEAPDGFIGLLLDIDVYWQSGDSDSPDVSELIEQLRLRERVAFEASIEDDCRNLFK